MTAFDTLYEAFDDICRIDAPLNVRLAAYADALRELNAPFADAYDALVARLTTADIGAAAPAIGDIMPVFLLPSDAAHLLSLEEILTEGPVVVSFNRGHWCPFCRIALRTIAAYHSEISACGAQVVSIIPDRQQFAGQLCSETFDKLHVVTDIDNGYALSLGLVMWLGDDLKRLMMERGSRLETFQGNQGWYVPLPATFVVGRSGRVIARFADPDFRRRMEIDDILAALKSDPPRCG